MTETVPPADNGHAHMLPFYSARTLDADHTLVTDLDRGLAVYFHRDHAFATIGTRGIRSFDGSPGLIIHLSVHIEDEHAAASAPAFIPRQLVHNTEHTPATEAEIKAVLIGTLVTAGLLPAGSQPDAPNWRFF